MALPVLLQERCTDFPFYEWLASRGLEQYAGIFSAHSIDFDVLMHLEVRCLADRQATADPHTADRELLTGFWFWYSSWVARPRQSDDCSHETDVGPDLAVVCGVVWCGVVW